MIFRILQPYAVSEEYSLLQFSTLICKTIQFTSKKIIYVFLDIFLLKFIFHLLNAKIVVQIILENKKGGMFFQNGTGLTKYYLHFNL